MSQDDEAPSFQEVAHIADLGNPRRPLRIRLVDVAYRGLMIDARRFFTTAGGELRPTSKGLMVPPDQVTQVIEALGAAHDELVERQRRNR